MFIAIPGRNRVRGFTLIEMIGVLAIIGILAAVATPKIFEAIRDSRISAFVQDVSTVRSAVVTYYKDTGQFPIHNALSANANQHQLMRQGTVVPGWKGPYLNQEMVNQFSQARNFLINTSTAAAQQFDFDGNGTADTSGLTSFIQVDGLTSDQAMRISDILDKDGGTTAGAAAWFAQGRVKTSTGAAPAATATNVVLYVHLASG